MCVCARARIGFSPQDLLTCGKKDGVSELAVAERKRKIKVKERERERNENLKVWAHRSFDSPHAHPTKSHLFRNFTESPDPETMYLSDKPRPIDIYKEEASRDMMIEVASNADHHIQPHQPQPTHQQHQMMLGDSSGEDHEVKAPKKRAETWVQDETRSLIALRREMDGLFNTSKSNKHLWEQISAKMRERGFDRSPTMCTDKWRNLLKEFKKAKHQDRGSGSAKMSYYKEIEEILKERSKSTQYKSPTPPKIDSYIQFSDKGNLRFLALTG